MNSIYLLSTLVFIIAGVCVTSGELYNLVLLTIVFQMKNLMTRSYYITLYMYYIYLNFYLLYLNTVR